MIALLENKPHVLRRMIAVGILGFWALAALAASRVLG